jgi:pantothenate kinase
MAQRKFALEVNGLKVPAVFEGETVDGLLRPLIDRMFLMKAERDERLVAFLAGPPGSGKSTLSLALQRLSDERQPGALQALAMDGFHHTAATIVSRTVVRDGETVPMARVKGSPESFDWEKLEAAVWALRRGPVRWPAYDRRLHDVVEDAIEVTDGILLVEGNWLLLNEPGFSQLRSLCDFSIALQADEALLKDRLIERKCMGGSSREAAEAHYATCDLPNIRRYRENSAPGEVNLRVTGDGAYERL